MSVSYSLRTIGPWVYQTFGRWSSHCLRPDR